MVHFIGSSAWREKNLLGNIEIFTIITFTELRLFIQTLLRCLICKQSLPDTVFIELLKKANIKSPRNVFETRVLVDSKISDVTSYHVSENAGNVARVMWCLFISALWSLWLFCTILCFKLNMPSLRLLYHDVLKHTNVQATRRCHS